MSHGITAPLVTVVVPSHAGADRIGETLGSLARQTMDPASFEVVVVLNGAADGTEERIREFRDQHPLLQVRTVRIPGVGAGRARNAGIAAAAGTHLTFVDDDDWVTPTFLDALVAVAEEGVVPLGVVADVATNAGDDGASHFAEYDNYINRAVAVRAGKDVPAEVLTTGLAFVAAKLVPTALARSVTFDESLRSGEDVVYWFDLFNRAPFDFRVADLSADAAYHRSIRVGSLSRQRASYGFGVSQRLAVIERLAIRQVTHPAAERARSRLIAAHTGLINSYLREAPDDHRRAVDEIRERGLESVLPFDVLNAGLARDLAIVYSFLPYAGTSAFAAARRIRHRGIVVDVVSNSMYAAHEQDPAGEAIAREFIGEHHEVPGRPGTFNWVRIEQFVAAGAEQIEVWESAKGAYRSVYSRSLRPASHVLAAVYKLQRPDVTWIAEFSDPHLWDRQGQRRSGVATPGPLLDELRAALAAVGVEVGAEVPVAELVELVAYAFADEIVFTNANQREVMLGYLGRAALEQRVRARSTVSEEPTLEPTFYHLMPVDHAVDPEVVNIGYFGAFHQGRRLGDVLAAVAGLTREQCDRIRVHVFTAAPDEVRAQIAAAGVGDVVVANPEVSYLATLNLASRMDVVLLNDARTLGRHARNPYLPSQWSDFAGSGTDVWAVVEPGSVLADKKVRYRSPLGDVAAMRTQLAAMIEDHR